MTTAKSDAVGVLFARESTAGTAPATGWAQLQPNPGGIQGWEPDFVDVNRNPLTKYATDEKGDHVGRNVNLTLVHDLNKDLADMFAEGFLRSTAKVPGNQGVGIYRPTAAADGGASADSFTVAADGDLPDGVLIKTRGFATAANNGVFVLAGTSTATAMKIATGTLTAETVSPTGSATIEVCGVQGTSGDVQLDASGNLTSTTLDFTTLNLVDGHRIKIGDTAAGTRFGSDDLSNGWAIVDGTPTANLISLRSRSWTPGGADTAVGKTIRLFFGRCYKNYATDDALYLEPTWHGEKEDNGVGTSDAAVFTSAQGLTLNSVEIRMAVQSKIEASLAFVGMDILDPVLAASRISGPSSAYVPIATEMIDTSTDLIQCRVVQASDDTALIAEVNSCTLQIGHGASARTQLATDGAAGVDVGKIRPLISAMEVYYERSTVPAAIRANTTCRFEAIMRNDDCGLVFDLPTTVLRGGKATYAENKPVMLSMTLPAHRDAATNTVAVINVMPYAPST